MAVVHRKITTVNEVFDKLDSIHADVQNKFHDQWNWIDAGLYVESLRVHYAELEAKLAALEWTPITPDNLPRLGDHLIRLNSSGTIGVSLLLDQWDGEYPTMDYCMNFTYRRPINPPQEPK